MRKYKKSLSLYLEFHQIYVQLGNIIPLQNINIQHSPAKQEYDYTQKLNIS